MLFNKTGKGADEIKGLIGWIYKANSFANLKTYLEIAKRQVVAITGIDVYNLALAHYTSSNYESSPTTPAYTLMNTLVHSFQLPIALIAYRKYAPGVDLQHSEQGRTITVTEQQKPAFEWMLDRDNANIMELANDAIDILLEFLDAQRGSTVTTIGTVWGSSLAYADINSLMMNSAVEFDRVYPINASRRLYITMLPFIREVEQSHIRAIVGAARYDEIIEKMRDTDLEATDSRILELARVAIALLSMSKALKRLSVEVLPDGIAQNYRDKDPKQYHAAGSSDRLGLAALLERDGLKELIPLQKHITRLAGTTVDEETETDTTIPFFRA